MTVKHERGYEYIETCLFVVKIRNNNKKKIFVDLLTSGFNNTAVVAGVFWENFLPLGLF